MGLESFVTRYGDMGLGVCPAHHHPVTYITVFVSSNSNVTSDGIPIITVGDIGISSCGHPTVAVTGSEVGLANEKGIHRVGDMGTNPGHYTVITGSPFVTSE